MEYIDEKKNARDARDKKDNANAAFGLGVCIGMVVGVMVMGFIAGCIGWEYNCTIKGLKADAVRYGFGEWVTCDDGNPGFKWKVPAEADRSGPQK